MLTVGSILPARPVTNPSRTLMYEKDAQQIAMKIAMSVASVTLQEGLNSPRNQTLHSQYLKGQPARLQSLVLLPCLRSKLTMTSSNIWTTVSGKIPSKANRIQDGFKSSLSFKAWIFILHK